MVLEWCNKLDVVESVKILGFVITFMCTLVSVVAAVWTKTYENTVKQIEHKFRAEESRIAFVRNIGQKYFEEEEAYLRRVNSFINECLSVNQELEVQFYEFFQDPYPVNFMQEWEDKERVLVGELHHIMTDKELYAATECLFPKLLSRVRKISEHSREYAVGAPQMPEHMIRDALPALRLDPEAAAVIENWRSRYIKYKLRFMETFNPGSRP